MILLLIIGIILAIIVPISTRLVQYALSRKREYLADASGVSLTCYPEGLASALKKIANKNKGRINLSEAVSHIFFVDSKQTSLDSLFAIHPPIKERIKRLRTM